MMRGVLGLVSLLIVAVGGALYFTEANPEVADKQTSQNIESQANKAAAQMANHSQGEEAQVDAAMGDKATAPVTPATNAPPAGN